MTDTSYNPSTLAGHRPGTMRPRDFDASVQSIASAAHTRGVNLMRGEQVVGSVEAAELCRTLRAAHEAARTNAHKRAHVAQLANGIAAKLGAKGPVQVSQSAWNLIRGYANPKKRDADE